MRKLIILGCLLGCLLDQPAFAGRKDSPLMISGSVFSFGYLRFNNSSDDEGQYLDWNYTATVLNLGVNASVSNEDSRAHTLFAGIGLGRYLQLQVGYGDISGTEQSHDYQYRLRSDIALGSIARGFSGSTETPDLKHWSNRSYISLHHSYHDTSDLRPYNQFGLGIGLRL